MIHRTSPKGKLAKGEEGELSIFATDIILLTPCLHALPDEHYGFKPTPEMRPFGQVVAHIALSRFGTCAALTGHKNPHIHLHTLEVAREHGVTFDAVQMPLNVMDAHFDSFEQGVLHKRMQPEDLFPPQVHRSFKV